MTMPHATSSALVLAWRVLGCLASACLVVAGLGCAITPVPALPPGTPAPRAVPPLPPPAAVDDEEPEPYRPPRTPFQLAWSQQTTPFNKGVALASNGHVGVLSTRHLTLYDGEGKRLAQRETCATFDGALSFVSDTTAAVVCPKEVRLHQLPSLEVAGRHSLSAQAHVAAFAPGFAAVGLATGSVRIYRTQDWTEAQTFSVGQSASALALSADAKQLAIGLDGGGLLLSRLAEAGPPQRIAIKRGLPVEALAFSPDGATLFAAAGPIAVALRGDSVVRRFRTVAGVTAAAWVGADEIGSVGRDGLLILDLGAGISRSVAGIPGGEAPVSVVTGTDQLCAVDRDGMLYCYQRGAPRPRRQLATTSPGDADAQRLVGQVIAFGGTRLQVRAQPWLALPTRGARVSVLRYTEVVVEGVRSARWVPVAEATVHQLDGDLVHLRLTQKLSHVAGLEGSTDPLAHDTPVKLVWYR